jgi:hypothetical protein
MTQALERLFISRVRCFCIAQKQRGVADAMIEADFFLSRQAVRMLIVEVTTRQERHRTMLSHAPTPLLLHGIHLRREP